MSAHLLSAKTKSASGRTKTEIEIDRERERECVRERDKEKERKKEIEDSAQVCERACVPVTVHVRMCACVSLHACLNPVGISCTC